MRLPRLIPLPQKALTLTRFYGLENAPAPRPGAFAAEENLTAADAPLLSVRPARSFYDLPGENGPFVPDGAVTDFASVGETAVICTENAVYLNGEKLDIPDLKQGETRRRAVPFGADFFLAPDAVLVKTAGDAPEICPLTFERALPETAVRPVYADFTLFQPERFWLDKNAPIDPAEWPDWVDDSAGRLVHYHFTDGAWVSRGEFYMALLGTGIGQGLVPGDRIETDVYDRQTYRRKGYFTVVKREDDRLLVTGGFIHGVSLPSGATLKKVIPEADLLITHGNRLWGCRRGKNEAGQDVNEIFASALGDPTRWYDFEQISTDSYRVSLGAPGPFTGAAALGQDLLFFKEDAIVRVGGYTPADFSVTVTPAAGIPVGRERCLAVIDELVWYVGDGGVRVYDGALARSLPGAPDLTGVTPRFAAAEDGRFLLFAAEGGKNRIFVCDPVSGDWHAEDDPFPVAGCARLGGTVVCLAPASDGTSFFARRGHAPASLSGWGRTPLPRRTEENVAWFAETGPLTAPDPNCVFRRLTLRVSLPGDAVLTLEAKAGAFGKWRRLGAVRAKREGTLAFRSRTEPADALFLRLSGVGDCRVHALTLIAEAAGEVTDRG